MKTLKLLATFLFVSLSLCSCGDIGNKKPTDLSELGLKGKVKSIIVKHFEAEEKFGSAVKTTIVDIYKKTFNEKGFTTEMELFNKEEVRIARNIYKYDEKGHRHESVFVLEMESGNGGKIKRSTKTVYKLNEQGSVLEGLKYSIEDLLEGKVVYKYNENNLKIEQDTYNANGDLIEKETYTYNKERQLIESEKHLNENGNEHKTTTEYWYNDKGYRSKMRFVSIDEYVHIDFMSSFEYEYDDKGNWIKEIIYSEEPSRRTPSQITEREIEYY